MPKPPNTAPFSCIARVMTIILFCDHELPVESTEYIHLSEEKETVRR